MNSKVMYHLKQETPMWHFQCRDSGSQKGATLRGSDVKPRLDKFLINQMNSENINWESFKVSNDHDALNYKIKIIAKGSADESNSDRFKAFFANIGRDVDKKHTIFYPEGIELYITCFIPTLMEEIEKHICAFFVINNFGTRQDKGFGGFIIDKKNGYTIDCNSIIEEILTNYEKTEGYISYSVDVSGCSDTHKILDNTYVLYQWMKSGINFGRTYKKSLLTTYMLEQGIGGEKRWMKKEGIAPKVKKGQNHAIIPDNREPQEKVNEYRYIRSVLGVSGNQSWFTDKKKGTDKFQKVDITVSSDEIERFQSPITIKLVENKAFFIAYNLKKEPFNELFNKDFHFNNRKSLKTPSDFDMENFMDYCSKEVADITFRMGKEDYAFNIKKLAGGDR